MSGTTSDRGAPTRRRLVRHLAAGGAALAAPAIFARPLRAAEFNYKYANNSPAHWPMNTRAVEYAERIRAETGGRLEIQVYPNNQLGSDTDMLSQLRSGAIEFFTLSPLILQTLVPAAAITGIGFAFKDYDAVWGALDGPLGDHVRAQIGRAGLVVMDRILDNGYRHVTTATAPVRAPADLQGFKIRVQVSPLSMSLFKAFGAAPTGINWSEIYSSLQTRIVDGQENPLSTIEANRIDEVQKYCSLTGHVWDGFHFLGNRRAWEALPEDVREVARRNLNAMAMAQRADMRAANEAARGLLERKGMVFNDVDREAFRAALRRSGYYEEWRRKFGDEAWTKLDQASGGLG